MWVFILCMAWSRLSKQSHGFPAEFLSGEDIAEGKWLASSIVVARDRLVGGRKRAVEAASLGVVASVKGGVAVVLDLALMLLDHRFGA